MTKATAFVIVPPISCPDGPAYLQELEMALRSALPEFDFSVTTVHERRGKDFVVAPDGTPDLPTMKKLLPILEQFAVGHAIH